MENLKYNPLLNELVLQIVFSHLPEDSLQKCRLVCWEWNKNALKALQNSSRYVVFGGLYKINVFQIRPDLDRIKLFMSAMKNSDNLPFVNFELRPNMFAPHNNPLLMEFLLNFGLIIQRLIVNLAYESADSFSEDCLSNADLTSLSILEFSNRLRGELRPSLQTGLLTTRRHLLAAIIHAAPNIDTINLWCDGENLAWPGEVFDVLCTQKLRYLRSLKISFPSNTNQLSKLVAMNALLSSFTFVLRDPIFDTDAFTNILETQSKTLKYLKILDLQCSDTKDIKLPVMTRLEVFIIEGAFYGENCKMTFSRFTYKQLPKLKTLKFIGCNKFNLEIWPFFFSSPCLPLNQLQLELSNDCINVEFINNIAIVFPHLTRICIWFSSESKNILHHLFECLSNHIEDMTLDLRKCRVNLDDMMTGISKDQIEKYMKHENEDLSIEKMNPGISCMKNLKYLTVTGELRNYKPDEFAFTDITAIHGIMALPKLKYIRTWRSGFSEKCLQELALRYDFVLITSPD